MEKSTVCVFHGEPKRKGRCGKVDIVASIYLVPGKLHSALPEWFNIFPWPSFVTTAFQNWQKHKFDKYFAQNNSIREEEQIQVSPATQRQSLFVKLHKLNGIKQRSDYHYLHRNISERFQNPRKPLFGFSHTLDTSCQQMHKRSGDKTQELADTPQGSDSLMLRCCWA